MKVMAPPPSNAHLTVEEVRALLKDELADITAPHGGDARLTAFCLHKTGADATTKMFVRAADSDRIVAVLILSRRAAPDLIDRGVQTAETIRSLIGAELGEAIIRPIACGCADGLSYVVLPCCREFSAWRPWRALQRRRLRRPLFRWLRSATKAAAQCHWKRPDAPENFMLSIEHLVRQPALSAEMVEAARAALARLESGMWRPRHTFDHNDLYLSNIMLPTAETSTSSRHPFVLIDWNGANPDGFGMYDLIRLARAYGMSPAALRRELTVHAEALNCELEDLSGHLLAAIGRLHQHLEHFPEERFMAIVRACWTRYREAAHAHGAEAMKDRRS